VSNHVENEKLIRRYFVAMNARDFDTVWDCFTDDVVYTDAALGQVHTGLDAFREFYMEYMLPLDTSVTLGTLITTDTHFGIGLHFHGKHIADLPGMPKTGKPFKIPSATIGTIQNGKIKTNTDYWNLHDLMTQLGFIAPPAA
jgi:steroid delta-isomerase-like uncharacterized protein